MEAVIVKTEEWKAVVGWEDYYEVSNQGRVRSVVSYIEVYTSRCPESFLSKRGGRILDPKPAINGYKYVSFSRQGESVKQRTIHSLVLEAFVGPCPEGMEGCHENGIRADCRLENLRWDTRSANALDRHKHGTFDVVPKGEDNLHHKLKEIDVKMIRRDAEKASQRWLADLYGVSKNTIADVIHKRQWRHI